MKKRIVIASPSLQRHDAVSNDVWLQALLLRDEGFEVYIYAEEADLFFENKITNVAKILEVLNQHDSILIYHHSCYWLQVGFLLENSKGKVVFRYHNITPAEFFKGDPITQLNLTRGRSQMVNLISSGQVDLYMPASKFNGDELVAYGATRSKLKVCSPFHMSHEFESASINQTLVDRRKNSDDKHILFVGRVAPHKGHLHLFKVLENYINFFDSNIVLTLIGKIGNREYAKKIENYVNDHKLGGHVEFIRDCGFEDLNSYFRSSDVFLMMSEHEGFGVPIIEAQTCGLPVVAWNKGACKETIGGKGFVVDELNYLLFAQVINQIFKNSPDFKLDSKESNSEFLDAVQSLN